MSVISQKFKEVLYSVLPITLIVIILHFTLTPMDTVTIQRFIIGSILIVLGLTIFLIGVDVGITPIGNNMGSAVTKSGKIWMVAVAGIFLGFVISIAEPDLHILAGQVESVTAGAISKLLIVVVVSLGIAVMLSLGLMRIVYQIALYKILAVLYGIILAIAIFASPEFIAISFDASGATTGALTVPFILAIAVGISNLKKDSKSSEKDSFGLVAIASTGAIIAVMLMSVIFNTKEISGITETEVADSSHVFSTFTNALPVVTEEVFMALIPIIFIFLVFQRISFKLSKTAVTRILFGMLFTFVGLVLFMLGVNAGFMDVGGIVGRELASMGNDFYVIAAGFILGMVTILAEPAVYVLTHEIEDVTSGYVKRRAVMVTLAIGVAIAVALSMVRILVPGVQLWHYLLPGYVISVLLTYFSPKLFVGIAFDSGGVASGPMTATFILAFASGVAEATDGADVLRDGFGMIAMLAMTPLIALQILGLVFKFKSKKNGVKEHDRDVKQV